MQKGFTLAEILIATAIVLVLGVAVANFAKESLTLSRSSSLRLSSELEGRRAIRTLMKDLRGALTLISTSTTAFTFTTDADDDGVAEQVRIYLDGTELKREEGSSSIVLASGVTNSSTTPIFYLNGRQVGLKVMMGAREHSSSVTLRNIE